MGLFDTKMEFEYEYDLEYSPYYSKKSEKTYAPQYTQTTTDSRAWQMDYAPSFQYIINSPEAKANMSSKKEGASQAPQLFILPSQSVSAEQSDEYFKTKTEQEQELDLESGGLMGAVVGIAIIGIGGLVAYKLLSKKKEKSKGKTKGKSAVPTKQKLVANLAT